MKKVLIITLILGFNFLNAIGLSAVKNIYDTNENIHINVSDLEYHPKNWLAIYPKGSNNEWQNVLRWTWTDSTTTGEFKLKGLPVGKYQVRIFYDNSYNDEAEIDISVTSEHNSNVQLETRKEVYEEDETIQVRTQNMSGHPKDWIAIYPEGSSTSWENVIDWHYLDGATSTILSFDGLKKGNYEVRAFFKNSYKIEASYKFQVASTQKELLVVLAFTQSIADKKSIDIDYVDEGDPSYDFTSKDYGEDWIGIYKKGTSVAWKNVLKWSFIKKLKPASPSPGPHLFEDIEKDLPNGIYEARFFKNNSYVVHKSLEFTIGDIPKEETLAQKAQKLAFDTCSEIDKDLIRETNVICPENYPIRNQETPFAYAIVGEKDSQGATLQKLYRVNLDSILIKPELLDSSSYASFEGKTSLRFSDAIKNNSKLDFIVVRTHKEKDQFTDENGHFDFYYANKEVLQFSYYEDQGILYNIKTLDNGHKLSLEYNLSESDLKYKVIYDISNPSEPKLIELIKTPI